MTQAEIELEIMESVIDEDPLRYLQATRALLSTLTRGTLEHCRACEDIQIMAPLVAQWPLKRPGDELLRPAQAQLLAFAA